MQNITSAIESTTENLDLVSVSPTLAEDFMSAVYSGSFGGGELNVTIEAIDGSTLRYCWKEKSGNSDCCYYEYSQRGNKVTYSSRDFGKWTLDT